MSSTKKITKEQFVNRSKLTHGNLYDYTLVQYINSHTKVKIICKIHGVFSQTPNNHYNYGCGKCGGTSRVSLEDFKDRGCKIHSNFYNYEKVIFSNLRDKVRIICPIHGNFHQQANSHLRGTGCPTCNIEGKQGFYNTAIIERNKVGNKTIKCQLYLVKGELEGVEFIKIGITTSIKKRFLKLPFKPIIINNLTLNLYDAFYLEKEIISKFIDYKITLPKFHGYTECFDINIEKQMLTELNKQNDKTIKLA